MYPTMDPWKAFALYNALHSFIHHTRDFPEGQVRTVLISSLYEVLFWQLAYQQ